MPEAQGEGGGGELGAPTNKLQQESGGTVLTWDRVGVSGVESTLAAQIRLEHAQ